MVDRHELTREKFKITMEPRVLDRVNRLAALLRTLVSTFSRSDAIQECVTAYLHWFDTGRMPERSEVLRGAFGGQLSDPAAGHIELTEEDLREGVQAALGRLTGSGSAGKVTAAAAGRPRLPRRSATTGGGHDASECRRTAEEAPLRSAGLAAIHRRSCRHTATETNRKIPWLQSSFLRAGARVFDSGAILAPAGSAL